MLIGLHGRARSGKDTVCRFITEDFDGEGVTVVRDAFADRLKLSAARLFYSEVTVEGAIEWADHFKQKGYILFPTAHDPDVHLKMSGREFLQRYGTEAHREVFDTDFWVNFVLPDAHNKTDYGRGDIADIDGDHILVITDVRFPSEAERVHACGGQVWYIDRPVAEIDEHASEQKLPDGMIDHTIINDGTLDDLREYVRALVWIEVHNQVFKGRSLFITHDKVNCACDGCSECSCA